MACVTAKSVGVRFSPGQEVLRQVDLHIESGEFVSIVGPSGCGKSTLLRLIAGLLPPSCGTLAVAGQPPVEACSTRQRLAFVFQDANLLPWRNVTDNIRLPLELQRVPSGERHDPVQRSLQLIGLTPDDAGKRPCMLSGGMKMRVSLARALVTDPDVMLLDEPFGALDDLMRQQLNEELSRIWLEKRWTGVFVTHNVSEAVYLSHRVLVMGPRPGTIVKDVRIPFEFPRGAQLRADSHFARTCGEVSRCLKEVARA
jgi:NitT/TauT family transport system ATP-binding protein